MDGLDEPVWDGDGIRRGSQGASCPGNNLAVVMAPVEEYRDQAV